MGTQHSWAEGGQGTGRAATALGGSFRGPFCFLLEYRAVKFSAICSPPAPGKISEGHELCSGWDRGECRLGQLVLIRCPIATRPLDKVSWLPRPPQAISVTQTLEHF